MSVVVTLDAPPQGGFGQYTKRGTIALGTYATSGVAVARTDFSLPVSLDGLELAPTGGYVPAWNKATGKVLVYWQTDSDNGVPLGEVDNSTDLSGVAFRFEATGK